MLQYTGHGKEEPGLTTARQALQQALFQPGFNPHRRGGTLAKQVSAVPRKRKPRRTVTMFGNLIGAR
jgi:hypothetical protein